MNHRAMPVVTVVALFTACAAPPPPPPPDPRALLRTERYEEALAEAERRASIQPNDPEILALVAAARAAVAAPIGSVESSVEAALRAVAASSRGRAAEAFAAETSGSQAFEGERFIAAARVMVALVEAWEPAEGDADARLGAMALLTLAAYGADHRAPMVAVGPLVDAAVRLLERSTRDLVFPPEQLHEAWICFRSAGTLADASYRASAPEISATAAEVAVRLAEAHEQQLSIAIACDLSSPRERLRDVLRRHHQMDLLSRLSATMERAEGCVIGTYAP